MKFNPFVPVVIVVLALAGCSDDGSTTTDSVSTSSLVAIVTTSTQPVAVSTTTPVTTAPSTSTSTTTTSSTSTSTSTTTTLPIGAELILRANGLGTANFGAEPDGVIAYVSTIIGPATTDSGWTDPVAIGCPGSEARVVTWGDLSLLFSNESNVTTGRRHFFNYTYGPSQVLGSPIAPAGLKTEAGVGVGATVTELKGTYPAAVVNPADDFGGPTFFINPGLAGFLSGVAETDTVMSIVGGQGCGE